VWKYSQLSLSSPFTSFSFSVKSLREHKAKARIDQVLSDHFQTTMLPKFVIHKLLSSKGVTVNGEIVTDSGYKVRKSDVISGELSESLKRFWDLNIIRTASPERLTAEIEASWEDVEILHEDEDVFVVNKRPGIVVHPSVDTLLHFGKSESLLSFLISREPRILDVIHGDVSDHEKFVRPGVVHRLDRDTSGVLVVAKSNAAYFGLQPQFEQHSVSRTYLAVLTGVLKPSEGSVETFLGRRKGSYTKRGVVSARHSGAQKATTHFRTLHVVDHELGPVSLVELTLETGRTHQIRVHMEHLKCPVLGDDLYGSKKSRLSLKFRDVPEFSSALMLHARDLGFMHPTKNRWVEFSTPPPHFWNIVLARLGLNLKKATAPEEL